MMMATYFSMSITVSGLERNCDLDGIIKSWNPGAERLFGYTAEEVIGKSIALLIPMGRHDEESDLPR